MLRTRLFAAAVIAAVALAALAFFLHFGAQRNWHDTIWLTVLISTGLLLVVACVVVFPRLLLRHSGLEGVDRAKAENDARGTLLQGIAGVALLAGAYVTWSQLDATQEQVSIATRQQVNDQFSRAVEQLGDNSQSVRLGGIYSLARLAENTHEENYPVLDILASYIRGHAPLTPGKPKDAATLGTLRLRAPDVHTAILQLTSLDRPPQATAQLDHSQLAGAELSGTHLSWISFTGSDLRNAQFGFNTKLDHSFFDEADLRGAEFGPTDLSEALFARTNLAGARLSRGTNLRGAILEDVNVCGADLTGANLDAVQPGMRLYADHKTQWPSDFDVSAARTKREVELALPGVRELAKQRGIGPLLEGCA